MSRIDNKIRYALLHENDWPSQFIECGISVDTQTSRHNCRGNIIAIWYFGVAKYNNFPVLLEKRASVLVEKV